MTRRNEGRRKYLVPRYTGPVLDEVARLTQNTRQGWRTRGHFDKAEGDYCFRDLLIGRARSVLVDLGMAPPSDPKHPLVPWIVDDMFAQLESVGEPSPEPRYLVLAPLQGVEETVGRRPTWETYLEGRVTVAIACGLSAAQVQQRLDASESGRALVIDTAKLLRGILQKLKELRQPLPSEELQPLSGPHARPR